MRKMTLLINFFLSIFLVSGTYLYSTTPKTKISNKIISKTEKQLKKMYNLDLIGIGGSSTAEDNKIQLLIISFEIARPMKKDEARRMLLRCIDQFVQNVNSNKEVQRYLKDVPFTEKNVEMAIFISTEDNDTLYHPDLCLVQYRKGEVSYLTNDLVDRGSYKSDISESYEEAVKKAKEESTGIPYHSNTPKGT